MPEAVLRRADATADFAAELGYGVAELEPEDLRHDTLTLLWGVSAWMRRCRVGVDEAWEGVLMLRAALLEASGLDQGSEPVPLRPIDPAAAFLNVVVYLASLVERAARRNDTPRAVVVAEAVALLQS